MVVVIMILGESAVYSSMYFNIRICCPGAKSQQLAWNECNVNEGAGSGCTVKKYTQWTIQLLVICFTYTRTILIN